MVGSEATGPALPRRTYRSPDEDSARWLDFPFREGDIVISTRSKSGTTWMQMICALLVFQTPRLPAPLAQVSPWLDWLVTPQEQVYAALAAQEHRRVIKTHTPLDGIPLDPRATYVVVARHPLDLAVSLYHHGANLDRKRIRELTGQAEPVEPVEPVPPRLPLREWLRRWVDDDPDPRQELDSLPGVLHHLTDAWRRRTQANVVLVHYDDLSADLAGEMRRIAGRLGITVRDELWPQLVEAAGFQRMRADADRLVPDPAGVLKDRSAFFRQGGSGAGRALLNEVEWAHCLARCGQLAPPDLLAWLHRDIPQAQPPSPAAMGVRIGWSDLPPEVRRAVEAVVGGPVVRATSQPGGFSPGSADRVVTADGRRAFVKAVSTAQNPESPTLHRRELRITAALPEASPAPSVLGSYDDGEWVALVLQDVEGRHPATPWAGDELDAVLRALHELAATTTPAPLSELPPTAVTLATDFAGWSRLAADPAPDLDPWAVEHLDLLRDLAATGLAALEGETLVHGDIRADNLLIRPDGVVTLVDWPWASRGPAWLDTLLLLVNVRLYGGHDVDALLAARAATRGAEGAALTGVLAGFAGFFLDVARRPPPPGLPTLREFQRAQGEAVLGWVQERLGRHGIPPGA